MANISYSGDKQQEIADLLFACGIAVDMYYSDAGSGAWHSSSAYKDKFKYALAEERDGDDTDFYDVLEKDMEDGKPAQLAIYREEGDKLVAGHSIVADGFRETWNGISGDYYHLNFGWGDSSPEKINETWYSLPKDMPRGYSVVDSGIVNIYPGKKLFITTYSVTPTTASPRTTLIINYTIHNPTSQPIDVLLGCSIQKAGTNTWIHNESNDKIVNVVPDTGNYSRIFVLPSDIEPGTYNMAWGLWNLNFTTQYDVKYSNYVLTVPDEKISIEASPLEIFADNVSTSTITVTVKDDNNQPNQGVKVKFSSDPSDPAGSLYPSSGITDNNGKASTKFKTQEEGTHKIIATVGSKTLSVSVTAKPPGDVFKIDLIQALVGRDPCRYEIKAYVTWKNDGSPVYNKTIRFETNQGMFDNGDRFIEETIVKGIIWGKCVYLTVDSDTEVTIIAQVENSSSSLTWTTFCGPSFVLYPITVQIDPFKEHIHLHGERLYQSEREVAWSSDGAFLATRENNWAYIYDTGTWTEVQLNVSQFGAPLAVALGANG